jgi:hypothetical protein
MTAEEFNQMVNEMVTERWPVMEGVTLLRRLAAEIQKTGGGRQRGEGIKWLTRIEHRLQQRFYLGEYGTRAAGTHDA